jgi:hypothetical protein
MKLSHLRMLYASNMGMIMNDELGSVRKETVVAYYKTLYNYFPRWTEKTYQGVVGLRFGIIDYE